MRASAPRWVIEGDGRIAAWLSSRRSTGDPRTFERLGFARWGELPRVAVLDGVERDLIIIGRRVAWGG